MYDHYFATTHFARAHVDEFGRQAAIARRAASLRRSRRRRHGRSNGSTTSGHRAPVARHFLEMVAAMVVGMMLLGGLTYAAYVIAGVDESRVPVELDALLMGFNMAVGMTVWMRYRGHGWSGILKMDGAMLTSFVGLFPLLWLGLISEDAMFGLGHVVMLPAMWVLMLRGRHA